MVTPHFSSMMADLLMTYGDTVTVYKHDGYGDEDDFWQDDQGWKAEGTEYTGLFENEPSETTLNQGGFADESDSAIWLEEEVVEKGDKLVHAGNEYVAISVSNFRANDEFVRQLIGVRPIGH